MLLKTVFDCTLDSSAQCAALHHWQPWILVGLSSSKIQLWDYRMKTVLQEFDGHSGAVYTVDFHPTKPLFVSAGEDCTLRLWSLETGQCLHKFKGHRGTVRTAFFHRDLPWILSASDDHYIIIWDWQSRRLIGYSQSHKCPVTCAKFHPKKDLVVSSSLDDTIRLWDLKLLKSKHYTATLGEQGTDTPHVEGLMLEDKVWDADPTGVNWVEFHPTAGLILSGGNDSIIKLWRFSTEDLTPEKVFTGHTGSITSVCFYPKKGLLLSTSKDGTVGIFDATEGRLLERIPYSNSEVSLVVSEQSLDTVAVVHNSGFSIFRLDYREPCMTIFGERLYFVNDVKQIQHYDYKQNSPSLPYLSLKKFINNWEQYTGISYNPSSRSVIVNKPRDGFLLLKLAEVPTGAISPKTSFEGAGTLATFISEAEILAFNVISHLFEIRTPDNTEPRSFSMHDGETPIRVIPSLKNKIVVTYSDCTILFDTAAEKVVGKADIEFVKHVKPSPDYKYFALASEHRITITDAQLKSIAMVDEKNMEITGLAWDDKNSSDHFLLYSAFYHLKYCLLNGESGTIKTLAKAAYLTKVTGNKAYVIDQDTNFEMVEINPEEYVFKQAVIDRDYPKVEYYIQNSTLVGENVVAFLQRENYPDIALKFVRDPQTRIDLLLECNDLDAALQVAQKLNDNREVLSKVLQYALDCGNLEVAEKVYQRVDDFDRLSFLYLMTGNFENLRLMKVIANQRHDTSRVISNSLFVDGAEAKSLLFKEFGSLPLAYLTAKFNGNDLMANKCLAEAQINGEDVILPDGFIEKRCRKKISSPHTGTGVSRWPLKVVKESLPSQLPESWNSGRFWAKKDSNKEKK